MLMTDQPLQLPPCPHAYVAGEWATTQYVACRIRFTGCATCCLACTSSKPRARVGGSGETYMAPACPRACDGPKAGESAVLARARMSGLLFT